MAKNETMAKKINVSGHQVLLNITHALENASPAVIEDLANKFLPEIYKAIPDSFEFEQLTLEDDDFMCEACEDIFDIEDSICIGGMYYCPECHADLFDLPTPTETSTWMRV